MAVAGIGAAVGAIGAHKASQAAKAQQAAINPLIQQQTATSKWALDQAQIDIPKARETLGGPLAFWNKILSGDRNAAMSVAGPSADQLAGQTAAANRTQAEFSPRGGRRTLMLGNQPMETTTALNQGLLALRPTAASNVTSIGQILAQLGLGEAGTAVSAGSSAISGQNNANQIQLGANAQVADAWKGVGSSIGQGLLALGKLGGDKGWWDNSGTSGSNSNATALSANPLQLRMYNPEHPTFA